MTPSIQLIFAVHSVNAAGCCSTAPHNLHGEYSTLWVWIYLPPFVSWPAFLLSYPILSVLSPALFSSPQLSSQFSPRLFFFYSRPVSTLSSYRQICPFRSLPLFLPAPNLPLTLRPCFPYSRPFLYAVRSFLFASRWNTQLLCISVIISPKCRISQWSYELLSTF